MATRKSENDRKAIKFFDLMCGKTTYKTSCFFHLCLRPLSEVKGLMKFLLLPGLLTLLTLYSSAQTKLLSPAEFLGYELGDRFTLHQRAIDYFNHVASAMPNAEIYTYGETYEHRP